LLDVEGEAMLRFHAGRGKDRANGARGATLLSDHFAEIGGSDAQSEHGAGGVFDGFDGDFLRLVDEGFGKTRDELDHGLGESRPWCFVCNAQRIPLENSEVAMIKPNWFPVCAGMLNGDPFLFLLRT